MVAVVIVLPADCRPCISTTRDGAFRYGVLQCTIMPSPAGSSSPVPPLSARQEPRPPVLGPRRVAIIGGGISGLAAANRLREVDPTAEITLFEASNRLGGVLQTDCSRDGWLI